jgi:hypothetical protein
MLPEQSTIKQRGKLYWMQQWKSLYVLAFLKVLINCSFFLMSGILLWLKDKKILLKTFCFFFLNNRCYLNIIFQINKKQLKVLNI